MMDGEDEEEKEEEEEDEGEEQEETASSSVMSVTEIQQQGFRFEYTELYRLIGRRSRASITQAWRLAATMKDEEIQLRSDDDQSTYLHHVINQVLTLLLYAQNPLDTFPRNFPADGEVANLLRTRYGLATGNWCRPRPNRLWPLLTTACMLHTVFIVPMFYS